jgi:hypothetical protein
MLVHRGRRIELGQCLPVTPVLLGADGRPVPRARRVAHLPRDPGRSDVEVFLGMPWNTVLHEEGQRTLQGLMKSATQLIETIGHHSGPTRGLLYCATCCYLNAAGANRPLSLHATGVLFPAQVLQRLLVSVPKVLWVHPRL